MAQPRAHTIRRVHVKFWVHGTGPLAKVQAYGGHRKTGGAIAVLSLSHLYVLGTLPWRWAAALSTNKPCDGAALPICNSDTRAATKTCPLHYRPRNLTSVPANIRDLREITFCQ